MKIIGNCPLAGPRIVQLGEIERAPGRRTLRENGRWYHPRSPRHQNLPVGQQGSRVIRAGDVQACSVGPRALPRVIDFRAGEAPALKLSAHDQHIAVGKKGGRVIRPALVKIRAFGEDTLIRQVEFHAGEFAGAIPSTCDQRFSVAQEGGGVINPSRAKVSGRRPTWRPRVFCQEWGGIPPEMNQTESREKEGGRFYALHGFQSGYP